MNSPDCCLRAVMLTFSLPQRGNRFSAIGRHSENPAVPDNTNAIAVGKPCRRRQDHTVSHRKPGRDLHLVAIDCVERNSAHSGVVGLKYEKRV